MKIIKKIICLCLCSLIFFNQIKPVHAFEPSTNDLNFHSFLAQYLEDNYLFDRLDQPMAHQFMYESMKDEFGEDNTLLTLTNMANDWGRTINGQSSVYEQIIIEILVNYVNSNIFKDRVEEHKIQIQDEIIQFINKSFDFECLKDDNKELFSVLSRIDFKSWKDVSKIPNEVFNKNIMNFVKYFDLPVSDSFFFNLHIDLLDFLLKVVAYQSICYEINGIQHVLEEMIYYTQNNELKIAIQNVLRKVDAARSPDIWEYIDEDTEYLAKNMFATIVKDVLLTSLSIVGLAIETSGFISNVVFKTDIIAESYLLLKSEIEIENLIKDVIRFKQNTYMVKKDDARVLTHAYMMLYSAYGYGTEITKKYGSSIYKSIGRLFNKDLYIKFFQDILNVDLNKKTYSYEDFLSNIHTWEGIISNDLTLFESGWLDYKELYIIATDSIEDGFDDEYVNSIYFENQNIIVELKDAKFSYPLTGCKSAPNQVPMTYTYTSSDPSIVSIENEHIYSIKAHKTGRVTISATSEDGLYRTTQIITVVDSQIDINEGIDIEEDLKDCYKVNKDGITLTKLSGKFLEKKYEIYHSYYTLKIPRSIHGQIVTELAFESIDMEKIGYGADEIVSVIIPSNVKRIADQGLIDLPDKCEVIFSEGLEEVGDNPFGIMTKTNRDIVLPSTLKSIGEYSFTGYNSIYVNCPNLKEIPKCALSCNNYVNFSNEMKQLKVIEESGLASVGFVSLPDCVEVLGKRALANSTFNHLPESLIEIGEFCFNNANILLDTLPNSVKIIKKCAFIDTNLSYLYIPNSIETIESDALDDVNDIYVYSESLNSNGMIHDDLGYFDYFEIPTSVTKIGDYLMSHNLVWTNGINEIVCLDPDPNTKYVPVFETNLYLNEIDRNGTYSIKNHIFSLNSYFNYIEIPTNYLNNTKKTLYGDWIKDCVIVGEASDEDLIRYVEILKDAIDVGGTITYRDSNGNLTLLYQFLPLSFEKESKFIYENEADYIIDNINSLKHEIKDTVGDLNITLSSNEYEYQNISLQCWKEEKESEAERAYALEDFLIFEDIYLKQSFYRYFIIDVEDESKEYVINLEIKHHPLSKSGYGLYHIDESQRITRIPITYIKTNNGYTIQFKTNELGKFAFARLNRKSVIIDRIYRDEYDYFTKEGIINKDTSIHYYTNNGNQSFIGTNESNTTIIKPSINHMNQNNIIDNFDETIPNDKFIQDEIINSFDLNDTLINRKEETIEITPEILYDYQLYEDLMNHAVLIKNNQENKIQIALKQLENQTYDFHIYKINDDGTLSKVNQPIQSIKEKKVNSIIHDKNQEYYELKLKEGNYFFTYSINQEKELFNPLMFLFLSLGIIGVVIIVIIQRSKKK